ncbi:uracil-xanthine permease family protein [Capillimicrobium parvum]|uniref:Pyrimidine permease RutG n=1 Tax=Capillimicrobium parvum TaxID=2884022 RepID=A0A9E6Y2L4_9ACTN|nr:solute carrier family 23 protein [Capillimicrobium parvum]UGS38332.1 Putative pyrimidine permease RutG [Capillimicrobium parvum]
MPLTEAIGRHWRLHGDGRSVAPGAVVRPDERLRWPAMIGLGGQHVLAMFGATALVPVLTGFPVSTTLLFSGIGTLLFCLLTRNRVPSYTGSSFAFIAPVIAAKAEGGVPAALGGILCAGVALLVVGAVVDRAGYRVVAFLLPPVVTGAIVALIGLNLAPVAKDQFTQQAGVAVFTLAAILIASVALPGLGARLSVVIGVVAGYVFAAILGKVDWAAVHDAAWVGWPDFTTPVFDGRAILLIVPAVILVLVAENAGHVKAVAAMTGDDLDPLIGRTLMADGAATALSGAFGGSGTTTYAENIGVMGLTRVYSTLAYIIAGLCAIALGLLPKLGAIVAAIPVGVLGGAVTVLFGMIAVLGARIWLEARVDFRDPVNLTTAAVALIVGAGNYTLHWDDYEFAGITLGTVAAIGIYQVLRAVRRREHVASA